MGAGSPPSRGAWIEIRSAGDASPFSRSPPSRGAWIEIFLSHFKTRAPAVAPLAGGVD